MINSKFKNLRFWISIFSVSAFILLFLFFLVGYAFNLKINSKGVSNKDLYGISTICIIGILSSFIGISFFYKKILVDETGRSISFKNIIITKITTYLFSEFDGMVETMLYHGGLEYKAFGLVKGDKVIRSIDSYFYSNYSELRNSLNSIKFLGQLNISYWDQFKFIFGKKAIN